MSQDWNKVLRESIGTPEVPGGRGRKRNGLIEHSTPESARAATEAVQRFKAGLAHDAMVQSNIAHHRRARARAGEQLLYTALDNHAYETARRQAKYIKPDRSRFLNLFLFLFTICMCILLLIFPPGSW